MCQKLTHWRPGHYLGWLTSFCVDRQVKPLLPVRLQDTLLKTVTFCNYLLMNEDLCNNGTKTKYIIKPAA